MATRSDNFDRANSTNLGANWTEDSGDWYINNNTVYNGSVGDYHKLRWTGASLDSNDYSVEVVCRSPNNLLGIGPAARMTTNSAVTYYALLIFGGDSAYLVYINNGNETILASSSGFTTDTATAYTLRIEVEGTAIRGYVNGTQYGLSATHSALTGGAPGIAGYGGGNTNAYADNWTASDLAAAPIALTLSATGVSATANDVDFAVLRSLTAAATAMTATTDAATLNLATVFSMALVAQAATETGDTVTTTVLRRLTASAASVTNTTTIGALALLRALVFAAQAPTATSARYGVRFYGNGNGQIDRLRIELDNPADPPIDVGAGDFCYEFWMRCNFADNSTIAIDNDARYSNIVLDRDIWAHERGWVLGVTRNASNTALIICFGVAGSGLSWSTIFGTSNVGDGRWHHVALTRAASTVRLFVDGVQEATGTYGGDLSYPNGVRSTEGQDNHYLIIGAEKHDVGFAYNGEFAAFRVSNITRYTAGFTPPQSVEVDGDTVALFLFEEQAGVIAYDTSGLAGAENAVLLVGGSPSGPVWTASGAVSLVLVSTIGLDASPTTSTATSALSTLRQLSSAVAATSATTENARLSLVLRILLESQASIGNADVVLGLLREITVQIESISNTGVSALDVLRAFVTTAEPATGSATATLNLASVIAAMLNATGGSNTGASALDVLRSIAQQAQVGTDTAAIDLEILRTIFTNSQAATATAEAPAVILRAIVASVAVDTLTGDATLNLAAVIAAAMSATGASNTDAIALDVLRTIAAIAEPATGTATASAAILRALVAQVESGTLTGDATLNLAAVIAAAMAATVGSDTAEAGANVLRSLSAQVTIDTTTVEALTAILRELIVDVGAQSNTAETPVAIQRLLYHDNIAGTATGVIDFRIEAIVGLLRILSHGALRPSLAASALRPTIHSGE